MGACLFYGSRYCDTDKLATLHGRIRQDRTRYPLLKAILDYTHDRHHVRYPTPPDAPFGRPAESQGRCRTFAHLRSHCAVYETFGRYCTAISAHRCPPIRRRWISTLFEVWLGGAWHTMDAPQQPRIGRLLMALGAMPRTQRSARFRIRAEAFEVITADSGRNPPGIGDGKVGSAAPPRHRHPDAQVSTSDMTADLAGGKSPPPPPVCDQPLPVVVPSDLAEDSCPIPGPNRPPVSRRLAAS